MLKRYHITLGAATTAGGTVTTASALISVDGAKIALEGDEVSCPACNAKGIIQLDGPRLSERFNNRQVALNDDLCVCKCNPPPKLVNRQSVKCQYIDADAMAPDVAPAVAGSAPLTQANAGQDADDQTALRLLHPDTREPFRRRPYKLQLTGKVVEGQTDDDGFTQPLSPAERASLVAWHVDE